MHQRKLFMWGCCIVRCRSSKSEVFPLFMLYTKRYKQKLVYSKYLVPQVFSLHTYLLRNWVDRRNPYFIQVTITFTSPVLGDHFPYNGFKSRLYLIVSYTYKPQLHPFRLPLADNLQKCRNFHPLLDAFLQAYTL